MGLKILKVKSNTGAVELGSALAHAVYQNRQAMMRAVGPLAVSQAVKAIAIAQQHADERGLLLSTVVSFVDVDMPDGARVSGLSLVVTATTAVLPAPTLV